MMRPAGPSTFAERVDALVADLEASWRDRDADVDAILRLDEDGALDFLAAWQKDVRERGAEDERFFAALAASWCFWKRHRYGPAT
jgi:predicted lipoprotein